jgi:hypothetical protein
MDPIATTDAGDLAFACPRCGNAAEERFYGVCGACKSALRATMRLEARDVEVEAYAPKMNVVPNQVALKED